LFGDAPEQAGGRNLASELFGDQKPTVYDPTEGMSTFDKMAAGAGKAMVDTGRGIGQMLGLVSRDDVAEARKRDQALMNTGAGAAGNVLGNVAMVAPTALIPGAATIPGAALIGAGVGMAQPSVSTKETFLNVGLGGAGGAAGQYAANKLPGFVRSIADKAKTDAAAKTAASAQKFGAAKVGSDIGYVVPPADLNPGVVSELASGLSGKIKTAQVASMKNQAVTDRLARRALGLADDANLDIPTLTQIRQNAGNAYQAVAGAGQVVPPAAYTQALDDAIKPFTSQSKSFPGRKVPAVVDDITSLKTQAFDAGDAIETIKVLRNDADAAYRAGDKLAGKAYKQAAEAMESAIDDHLVKIGAPADLLKNYRDARQTIAKTYTIQSALNPETGSINAQKLAGNLAKGKPLSGELKQVANFATAFPKATQALKEAPKNLSPLDMVVALGGTAGTGNPMMLAGLAARPATRSLLLSKPVQNMALKPGFRPSLTSQALPYAIDNGLFRMLAAPAGMTGGLLANPAQQ
jgi:hypothetical protein